MKKMKNLFAICLVSFFTIQLNGNPIPWPFLFCDPSFLDEYHPVAPQITTQQFYLYNDTYLSFNFFIETEENWLSVEPSSGYIEEFGMVLCTVTINSLPLPQNGYFFGDIEIFDNWTYQSFSLPVFLQTANPCEGFNQVLYQGQTYNPAPIGNQCWLKENMNVGSFAITGFMFQSDNGIIEKYCYDNNNAYCDAYGGLYTWHEAMQYGTNGAQGICPPGWRIPSDQDWITLEGETDSYYNPADPVWNQTNFRGFDAAIALKSAQGWYFGGNGANESGFTALPAGHYDACEQFYSSGTSTYYWSSTGKSDTQAWFRIFSANSPQTGRRFTNKNLAASVRCIRD